MESFTNIVKMYSDYTGNHIFVIDKIKSYQVQTPGIARQMQMRQKYQTLF